jgi:SlyX protein
VNAELDELKTALAEVQSQLAFQEDTVESLNAALASQQQEILTLRRQLALLKQRLDEQAALREAAPDGAGADEKPPHY